MVAMAIHVAAFCPPLLRKFVPAVFPLMLFAFFLQKLVEPVIAWHAHWAWWVPPSGWLNYAFQRG